MTSTSNQTPQYLRLYGLKVAPFRLSPDPAFFYPAPSHLAAEKILQHAISNGEGFMVLTGQAGLGKTLLLRRLLENFDDNKVPILILSPAVTPAGLLQLLLGEMEIDSGGKSSQALLLQLFQNHVLELAKEGKELFIIVDEAQNMPVDTLEQLRMLSNLETGQRKLMQILLIGQTELEKVLKDHRLGQLVQRIVIHERLSPLNREQILQYVWYRLNKAGRGDIYLSHSACRVLHRASRGIPRLVNRIMDRTLLLASVDQVTIIKKDHLQNAISTMKDINQAEQTKKRIKAAILTCTLLFAVVCLLYCYFFTPVFGQLPAKVSSLRDNIMGVSGDMSSRLRYRLVAPVPLGWIWEKELLV